jgi:NitT/TauT family transport system substrate-binding protein
MRSALLAAIAAVALAAPAAAQTKITVALNWVAGGDHAPLYWAQRTGLYKAEGLDVEIEQGRGSAASAQRIAAGAAQIGISDMGVVLTAIGKGADLVAVHNIYANSPQGLYWVKSSGINGVKDMKGKKIGNPPGDAARAMWPALAQANGLDPKSVTWVNIDANAKLGALKAGTIDVTTSFYNLHHVFARELGADLGFLAWRDIGLNPYGNSFVANGDFLRKNKEAVGKFVKVTQKAYAECVKNEKPCIEALVAANGALLIDNETTNWHLVKVLMSDEISRKVALGWHDDQRMANDYELVKTYLGIEKPYDVKKVYTNEFLDQSIKMTAVEPPKF